MGLLHYPLLVLVTRPRLLLKSPFFSFFLENEVNCEEILYLVFSFRFTVARSELQLEFMISESHEYDNGSMEGYFSSVCMLSSKLANTKRNIYILSPQ